MPMIIMRSKTTRIEDSFDDNGNDGEEEEIRDKEKIMQKTWEEEENTYYAPLENKGNNIFTFYF